MMSFFAIVFILLIVIVVLAFSFVGNLLSGFVNLFRSGSSKSNGNGRNTNDNYGRSSKKEYDDDDLVRSEEGEKRLKLFKESAESVDFEEVK